MAPRKTPKPNPSLHHWYDACLQTLKNMDTSYELCDDLQLRSIYLDYILAHISYYIVIK